MGVDDVDDWRKSSHSDNGEDCVEVGTSAEMVTVRDTKRAGNSPLLRFSPSSWTRFITSLQRS